VLRRAWTLVNRNGSYHERHLHDAAWSAIYYVTSGSGATIFDDGARIVPEAGLLVMFRGHLYHRTEPADGPMPRITIAFDAS